VSDDPDIEEAPGEEIARLERRIEELADHLERCRKIDFVAKALVTGGVLAFLAGAFGFVGMGPMLLLSSIAATLGGIVLLGSNGSSMQQVMAAVAAAETRRNALIGEMELRTVPAEPVPQDSGRWLH
jgi:hypothetical protein